MSVSSVAALIVSVTGPYLHRHLVGNEGQVVGAQSASYTVCLGFSPGCSKLCSDLSNQSSQP